MPRMTGLHAARQLNQYRPRLRILILSMHENERYVYEALKAGASGYVVKTVADRDLVESCRAAMRGERFLYPGAMSALIRDYLHRVRNDRPVRDEPLTRRELEIVKLIAEAYRTSRGRRTHHRGPEIHRCLHRKPAQRARCCSRPPHLTRTERGHKTMNITQTQLVSRLRTWTLVAGLTGLVIALGALIGGSFLWLFAGLAIVANLIGYFYSDRIALRAVGAQRLEEERAPEVHRVVSELSARAHIPGPRLYLMPGDQPNAFATGRDPAHAAVAMTEGLLTDLPLTQIRGVLAHELAHIKNRDILVSSLAATIAGAISAIASILQLSFLFGGEEEESPLGFLGGLAAVLLAPLGAMLLQLGVSRQREYLADATAAQLLGCGAPLADALEEISLARASLDVSPVSAPMYIVNPLGGGNLSNLFSTHPPVGERIRRLRSYDAAAQGHPAVLRPLHATRSAA
jgi:heat shock protein HtpX